MSNIIKQSFSLHIRIMRLLGQYPSKKHPTFQKIKAYSLYCTLLVGVVILVIINLFHKEHSDTVQTNIMVMFIIEGGCLSFKGVKLIKNSQEIQKCIEYFGHERFAPKNHEERRILNDCVQVCRRNSLIWISMLCSGFFGFISLPLLAEDHQLPVDIWLPYDHMSGPVFYSTYVFITAAAFYNICTGFLVDALIGGLAYHATIQLKILKYNLQNLSTLTQHKNSAKVSGFLRRCVRHHNYILKFVADYEKCFSFPVFCQIVGCTFAICYSCIGFLVVPPTTFNVGLYAIYFSAFSAQIFFYCYYGTLLFEENDDFINAIYMGPWYEYDVKIRKFLILMMERSKKPMIVTAGKIIDLTLLTFTSLLKTSYSLIAMLKNY